MGFKTINSQEIYATCETSSPRVDESETKEFLVMHLPRFCEPWEVFVCIFFSVYSSQSKSVPLIIRVGVSAPRRRRPGGPET